MIYKFKSQATGDLIMLGADGDQMLRLLGREPTSPGIIDVQAMPAALAALEAAVAAESQADKAPMPGPATAHGTAPDEDSDAASQRRVALRQRLWPMVEMLRQAHAAGQPIVWGV